MSDTLEGTPSTETTTPAEALALESTPETTPDPGPQPAAADASAASSASDASDASDGGANAGTEGMDQPLKPQVEALVKAMAEGAIVDGKVFGWNQGGFHVLIDGVLAFCPRSEIEVGNPRSPKQYLEKTFRFQVIDYRKEGHRFTVSRSGLLKEEREKLAAETRARLQVDAVLEGRVSSLTNFGAFIDLGGVEGMVHVSEISHRPVGHPKDVLKPGKKVQVKVLKIEEDGKRISLSMKALEENPWDKVAEAFPRGNEFTGKINRKSDFGLFVEIAEGIEGLVHVSALPPGVKMEDPSLAIGNEVHGWIKDVEPKRQRVSLSLRELSQGNPWKGVEEKFPEGTIIQGTVEEVTPFGAFIALEPGLTGLLPTSEMGLARGTHPSRVYNPGSTVTVQVGRIDSKRKRITLLPQGKQMEGSQTDYREFLKKSQKGSGTGLNALAAAFAKLQPKG